MCTLDCIHRSGNVGFQKDSNRLCIVSNSLHILGTSCLLFYSVFDLRYSPIPIPKDKDVAKYKQASEQAEAKLKEPTGGDYGSYWDNYWDTEKDWKTCNTKGHDGSEWNLYYYKPSAEYIVLRRPASNASWEAVATIRTKYDYTNGQVANP